MSEVELTFPEVDGVAFAADRVNGFKPGNQVLVPESLGPFMEYAMLSASGIVPRISECDWLRPGPYSELYGALRRREQIWLSSDQNIGLFKTRARDSELEAEWMQFSVAAHKSVLNSGLHKTVVRQLIGAMGELEDNVFEHSQAPDTGLVVYRTTERAFEFVIADRGIGVLQSLRSCPEYQYLEDHGEAIRLAIADGTSRYGRGSGRGLGFKGIFTGLASFEGSLRFRSGDHAVVLDGLNPVSVPATIAQKPSIAGFFSSVKCRF